MQDIYIFALLHFKSNIMNLLIITTVFAPWHVILIFGAILLMFGGKKIPELMGGIGKGMKEFKKAIKEDEVPAKETPKEAPKETPLDQSKEEPKINQ